MGILHSREMLAPGRNRSGPPGPQETREQTRPSRATGNPETGAALQEIENLGTGAALLEMGNSGTGAAL